MWAKLGQDGAHCHIASILHQYSPIHWCDTCDVIMVGFHPGVVMWELWSGAQTPYLDLRNQEVKGKVNATYGIHQFTPGQEIYWV